MKSDSESAADARLYLCGLRCPLPVLKAAKVMRAAAPGAVIEVLTDDAGSLADFSDFCAAHGYELIVASEHGGVFRFLIRR